MNTKQIRARLKVLEERGYKRAAAYRRRGIITAGNTWEEMLEAEWLQEQLPAHPKAADCIQDSQGGKL